MKNALLAGLLMSSYTLYGQALIPSEQNFSMGKVKANPFDQSDDSTPKPKVFLYGIGGADVVQLSDITASGGVFGRINLHNSKKWSANAAVGYNLNGTVSKESADSVKINALYFPDISSSAFIGSFELMREMKTDSHASFFEQKGLGLNLDFSAQQRNLNKDSANYSFNVISANAGPKFRWYYQTDENLSSFTLAVNIHWIRIAENSSESFSKLFNDYVAQTENTRAIDIYGLGILAAFQLNNTTFFFKAFDDFSKSNALSFSVGIKSNGKFLSF